MFSWPSFISVFGASLASLGLGLDVGMISSTIVQPTFLDYFDHPSPPQIGGVVAAFSAGGAIGAYGCAVVSDRYGRVKGLLVGATIAVIGAALQAGAAHIAMLILGRLINGMGAGQLLAVFPVYASEVAPPKIRGTLGGLQMFMINIGIFVATAAGYGFGIHYSDSLQWRGPLAVQIIPVAILIVLTFFLPETPRWLLQKGRHAQARDVIRRLHHGDGAAQEAEFAEVEAQLRAERESFKPTWREIATKPSWRRRALLVLGLQVLAQFTGVNCVQYYAATIYQKLGFDNKESLMLNLLYGAMGPVFSAVWLATIDRIPRVRMMIVAEIMMAASLLVQGVLSSVYINEANPDPNALNAQVAMFFVFNLFFVAVGMLSWLFPPEMCPMAIRAKISSMAVSVNNIAGLLIAEVAPIALDNIGFAFFFVFVGIDVVGAVIAWFCFPETSKLTLEEIDVIFGDEIIEHAIQGTAKGLESTSQHMETVDSSK